MLSIDVTPKPAFIPAQCDWSAGSHPGSLTGVLVGTAPGCDSAAPGQHEVGRASGRIYDPAYLHGRAHVGLEVSEILLVRRHPMITRGAHQGQSQLDALTGIVPVRACGAGLAGAGQVGWLSPASLAAGAVKQLTTVPAEPG